MSKHPVSEGSRVTVQTLRAMVSRSEHITMTTAYDATFARMLDEGGADVLLVGDSLGMVVQGLDTTLPVTLDEIVYHARAVSRGARRAHLVGDMPFMSYQVCAEEAMRNAGRFLSEGGMQAVKLEGGTDMAPTIHRLVSAGIPVMGHVGLTPQSVHAMGGFKVQGKAEDARRVLADAKAVAEAGAYAIVLEGIPRQLAAEITAQVHIPTIGIGAGPDCDGQVLVCYDLLGLTSDRVPKFVKQYESFFERGVAAMQAYREEVRSGTFPSAQHSFGKAAKQHPAATDQIEARAYPLQQASQFADSERVLG
ncbi:MAG: 3-methyl-2-oxobutanoate hydroxymethyltransferase [Myxococcales bacterium]|nr:3-methyl-2-oxobutanoate hydroxymethyltransferase [Myxococcales bacterium]MDD9964614.1 3-methyl-2-oxobutanoate hydroxymethyltransferase [Myxococcales bacterium]